MRLMTPPFERPATSAAKKAENPIDTMEDELHGFIGEHDYTAHQVSEAYFRMMAGDEQPTDDPVIITLLTEMRRLEQEGFPASRYPKIIIDLQNVHDMVPAGLQFIAGFPVTEGEKAMLRSLIEKKRGGHLQVTIGDEPMFELTVRGDEAREHTATGLRVALEKILTRANGRSIRLDFVE